MLYISLAELRTQVLVEEAAEEEHRADGEEGGERAGFVELYVDRDCD